MSSSNSSINTTFIKGGIAMATAVAFDIAFTKETNLKTSLMIGAVAGAGVVGGNYLAQMVPALIPDDTAANKLYTGQAIMERAFEVGGSTAAIMVLERYAEMGRQDSITEIVGVSLLAVAVSEVIADYVSARPISIFA